MAFLKQRKPGEGPSIPPLNALTDGETVELKDPDFYFKMRGFPGRMWIEVMKHGRSDPRWAQEDYPLWTIELVTPDQTRFVNKTYADAQRAAFKESGRPGLDIFGQHRGQYRVCSKISGEYEIMEIAYESDGGLSRIKGKAKQHCEGKGPLLRALIDLRSDSKNLLARN
jgi:hypothetical protein